MEVIQAVLADGNATIRSGVRALQSSAADISIVAEAILYTLEGDCWLSPQVEQEYLGSKDD